MERNTFTVRSFLGGHTMQHYDYDTWVTTDPADAIQAERDRRMQQLEAAECWGEADREER